MSPAPRQPRNPPPPSETPSPTTTSSSTSPSPSAGDSSAASSAEEFLADPGPAFDPKQAPEAPALEPEDEPLVAEGWQEETIRSLLVTQGNVTHMVFNAGPEDTDTWKHTQDDLRAIAPPLTRILNRYDASRAAAAAGDEIALIAGLAAYGGRNYTKRKRLLAAQRAAEPQPITGVAADPDVGPEFDPEYQRIHEPPPALVPKGHR